jgi:hypothetical protein
MMSGSPVTAEEISAQLKRYERIIYDAVIATSSFKLSPSELAKQKNIEDDISSLEMRLNQPPLLQDLQKRLIEKLANLERMESQRGLLASRSRLLNELEQALEHQRKEILDLRFRIQEREQWQKDFALRQIERAKQIEIYPYLRNPWITCAAIITYTLIEMYDLALQHQTIIPTIVQASSLLGSLDITLKDDRNWKPPDGFAGIRSWFREMIDFLAYFARKRESPVAKMFTQYLGGSDSKNFPDCCPLNIIDLLGRHPHLLVYGAFCDYIVPVFSEEKMHARQRMYFSPVDLGASTIYHVLLPRVANAFTVAAVPFAPRPSSLAVSADSGEAPLQMSGSVSGLPDMTRSDSQLEGGGACPGTPGPKKSSFVQGGNTPDRTGGWGPQLFNILQRKSSPSPREGGMPAKKEIFSSFHGL